MGDREEVERVGEMMDMDVPRVQNGRSGLGNTGVPSGTAGSGPVLSATEMESKKSSVLDPSGPVLATVSDDDRLEGCQAGPVILRTDPSGSRSAVVCPKARLSHFSPFAISPVRSIEGPVAG